MKILLLEDDKILSESLIEFLELENFEVTLAENGEEVYDLTFNQSYDLYIFDINVPKENGFEVLKALREANDNTPTIYITALTDINSISKGFEIGAEDYIKKPFDPQELIIRIKSKYMQKDSNIIELRDITYNLQTKELRKAGHIIGLGDVQQNIFHELISNINSVVPQYVLLDKLENSNPNALRVNLAKIKNRLEIDIKNIRSQGYMIEKIWKRVII